MNHNAILKDLDESGIIFEITCFSGGGFRVRFGGPISGFSSGAVFDRYGDIVPYLCEAAIQKFPHSAFARKYAMKQMCTTAPRAPTNFIKAESDTSVVYAPRLKSNSRRPRAEVSSTEFLFPGG
jgi:hypothetical protein